MPFQILPVFFISVDDLVPYCYFSRQNRPSPFSLLYPLSTYPFGKSVGLAFRQIWVPTVGLCMTFDLRVSVLSSVK